MTPFIVAPLATDPVDSFLDCLMLSPAANAVRLTADRNNGHAVVHAALGGVLWTFREAAATEAMLGLREAARMLGRSDLRELGRRLHLTIRQAGVLRGARAA